MPHRLLRIHVVLGAAALLAACAPHRRSPATSPIAAEQAIRARLDTTALGWNRGDLEMYLSDYTDDVSSAGANGFVYGKAAAREVMQKGFWRSGRPLQQLHYEHVNVRMLGADHALVTGQYVLTGADRPDRTGWFTTVWVRTADGWRCMHDQS